MIIEDRKARLIEIEKNASEFVEVLRRMGVEAQGYRNAGDNLLEARDGLLRLADQTTTMLESVMGLTKELQRVTSDELFERLETLSAGQAESYQKIEDSFRSQESKNEERYKRIDQKLDTQKALFEKQSSSMKWVLVGGVVACILLVISLFV
jgi:hypothetical protein